MDFWETFKIIVIVIGVGFGIWEKIVEFLKSLKSEVADYVTFGRYPQAAKGEVRPVEWRVLARKNNKALVISRYGLDAMRFDSESNDWSESEIRKWLNGEFYNSTFSGEEKARIKSFNQDYVFLLSRKEAEKYFADDDARRCKPTAYAKAKGADVYEGCCYWWLRSPLPMLSSDVCFVDIDGFVHNYSSVHNDNGFMRPALWINLES